MTPLPRRVALAALFVAAVSFHSALAAAPGHSFLRRPAVHADELVFTSEGDLWLASLSSGAARRITTSPGTETDACFSPDGRTLAFDAQYDGGTDVYVMPVGGGSPKRLTWEARGVRVVGWTPDGASVLYLSRRANPENRPRLWSVPASGGLPKMLPIPRADLAAMAPDGKRVAFVPVSAEWQHWKRYKGGQADDIWLTDITAKTFKRITTDPGIDTTPAWAGNDIYFISERDGLANLYRLNPANGSATAITHYTDEEARYPSSDGKTIVFQHGDGLAACDVASGKVTELNIRMDSDRIHARVKRVAAGQAVNSVAIGPTGKRVVAEARGQILSVPVEEGDTRILAPLSGSRSQYPAWSDDGKQIAFVSDRSGEDQVWIVPADGNGVPRQVTKDHKGPLGRITWSPDGKRLLTSDREMRILLVDAKTGITTLVDQQKYGGSYDATNDSAVFSPDSKWIAFDRTEDNLNQVVYIYNIATGQKTAVSSPEVNCYGPAWDSDGKYLLFLSDRDLNPSGSGITRFFTFDRTTRISMLTLAASTKSPFLPGDDEEGTVPEAKDGPKADDTASQISDEAGENATAPAAAAAAPRGAASTASKPKPGVTVKIDMDGLADRIVDMPAPGDRYRHLECVGGRVLVLAPGDGSGRGRGEGMALKAINLKKPHGATLTTVATGVSDYQVSGDNNKLLLRTAGAWTVVDASASSVPSDAPKVDLDSVTLEVDPAAEWKQIFEESWRVARDFFYDPNLYGADWNAVHQRYAARAKNVGDRGELNEVLGDMIAELNAGHAYVGGGDMDGAGSSRSAAMGYLGADYEPAPSGNAYRITHLLRGDGFDLANRSPLLAPGISVKESDFIVGVAGQPISTGEDIQASLVGTAGRVISLNVNTKPTMDGSRRILVRPIADESKARYYDWIDSRRRYVLANGGPNLGYIHIPDMGNGGLTEFGKHYYANLNKDGIVYDTRYNGGGYISAMLMLQMARKPYTWFKPRYGAPWTRQDFGFAGYSVCLINEKNGSNGEEFPDVFRREKLGPVIGVRSWGGEVGSGGGYRLIDGGRINIPNYGEFADGKWIIEGRGIDPDITVEQDPNAVLEGKDPQLDRAIAYLKEEIAKKPVTRPVVPAFPLINQR